jgi:hypothetical protein
MKKKNNRSRPSIVDVLVNPDKMKASTKRVA